jgi:hypothetical protein
MGCRFYAQLLHLFLSLQTRCLAFQFIVFDASQHTQNSFGTIF